MPEDEPFEAKQKALGNRIRELRRQRHHGQSTKAFAARCGLDEDLLEQIESGRAKITVSMIAGIAAALETQVATLLEDII